MHVAYYDIETQECSHFHLDDGDGIHPSFKKTQIHERKKRSVELPRHTSTRSYEFPKASFSKSVTNYATSSAKVAVSISNIVHNAVVPDTTPCTPITGRDDIVDYIAKIRPRSSATNARSCSAGWIIIRRLCDAD